MFVQFDSYLNASFKATPLTALPGLQRDVAVALLPALVVIRRMILDGSAEESPAREAGHGPVVDVFGRRLQTDFALFGWRN